MSSAHQTPLLDVTSRPGTPPVVRVEGNAPAASWISGQREPLLAAVAERGALLIRGLDLRSASDVAAVLERLAVDPVTEREAFAPRQTYAEGVYSSSKWPPHQPMCMHHELSYTLDFPALMLFGCLDAPAEGGATAVADAAAVLDSLPPGLTERFEQEGWLLTRSYNGEIGATLTESFGSDSPAAVESYCDANDIRFAWQPDGSLRTRQRRGAVLRHPVSGLRCWFNQVAFLNQWTLDPEVREYLTDEYGSDGLPFNTRYGNGDPITEETVQLINKVYDANTARLPWQTGDLLLVDNIRTAHSREAYQGPRDVVVAMAGGQHRAAASEATLP